MRGVVFAFCALIFNLLFMADAMARRRQRTTLCACKKKRRNETKLNFPMSQKFMYTLHMLNCSSLRSVAHMPHVSRHVSRRARIHNYPYILSCVCVCVSYTFLSPVTVSASHSWLVRSPHPSRKLLHASSFARQHCCLLFLLFVGVGGFKKKKKCVSFCILCI